MLTNISTVFTVRNFQRAFFALLLTGIFSCSKDKSATPPAVTENRVNRFEVNGKVVGSFAYDDQGRLTEYVSGNYKNTYSFEGIGFGCKVFSNNVMSGETKNVLLENGRLSAFTMQNYNQGLPSGSYTYSFIYNNDGTLKGMSDGTGAYDFQYSNGNFVQVVKTVNGVTDRTTTYEYYTELPNKFNLPIMEYFFEYPILTKDLLGPKTKNLLKKVTTVRGANTYVTSLSYTLDGNGYPTAYHQVYTINNDAPVHSDILIFY